MPHVPLAFENEFYLTEMCDEKRPNYGRGKQRLLSQIIEESFTGSFCFMHGCPRSSLASVFAPRSEPFEEKKKKQAKNTNKMLLTK
jgi:hypothetical protein